jgi:hypothetical protein
VRRVERLVCRAELDREPRELARARAEAAAGDESWAEWVQEYDSGEAMLLRLDVFAHIEGADSVHVANTGVWIEADVHPPLVAGQVQQAVSKDYNRLAEELRARGVDDLTAHDLADMYVEVQLGDDLLAALAAREVRPRRLQPQASGD